MKLSYLFFSFENIRLQIKGMLKQKQHFDKVKISLKYFISKNGLKQWIFVSPRCFLTTFVSANKKKRREYVIRLLASSHPLQVCMQTVHNIEHTTSQYILPSMINTVNNTRGDKFEIKRRMKDRYIWQQLYRFHPIPT